MSETATSAVTVRPAEKTDAAALAGLLTELGYETRTAEMEMRLEPIMKDSRYSTFVAVSEGKVCGMIGTLIRYSYEYNNPGGRILALVVSENARGKGIGRALLAAAENGFVQRGVRRVAVLSRFEREKAHEFYEKSGYERNGFRFVKNLGAQPD